MSHGYAGVVFALERLVAVAGDRNPPYINALLVRLKEREFELYDPVRRNWPDLRSGPNQFVNAWCHGATGIGLARIAGVEGDLTEPEKSDVFNAAELTLLDEWDVADHVCCGLAGRIEFLHEASLVLGDNRYRERALELAEALIGEAKRSGYYKMKAGAHGAVSNPGFFQGLAGIGYTFLRLTDNDLPSVLGFEW